MSTPVPGDPKLDEQAEKIVTGIRSIASHSMMRNLSADLLREIVMAAGHLLINALGYWMIRVHDQSVRSKSAAARGRRQKVVKSS